MFPSVPIAGRKLQCLVILRFAGFNYFFNADVTSCFVSESIEHKQQKQTGNTSVAISKRVNAKKIKIKCSQCNQRRNLIITDKILVFFNCNIQIVFNVFRVNGLETDSR